MVFGRATNRVNDGSPDLSFTLNPTIVQAQEQDLAGMRTKMAKQVLRIRTLTCYDGDAAICHVEAFEEL